MHCDAVQAAGKVPVDLHGLGVDYLSLSAHKLGGPTGVGALVVRAGRAVRAPTAGGGQEANRRAGTENVAGIAGFGAAAEASRDGLDTAALRDRLEAGLRRSRPAHGSTARRRRGCPTRRCISMPGVKAETQVMALDLAGVCVSAGAACSSGKVTGRRCWRPWAWSLPKPRPAIRISLRLEHGSEDIDRLIAAWQGLYIRVTHSDLSQARGGLGISRG